jgi:hypothetical protein
MPGFGRQNTHLCRQIPAWRIQTGSNGKMEWNENRSKLMQNAPVRTVFTVITDFLATNPTPQEIVAYHLPDDLDARAHELLDRLDQGSLTPAEHEEMVDFRRVEQMMSLLKAKMFLKLRQSGK